MSHAVIHDLGYRPYTGPRRPQPRRFLVIARNVFTVAWRQRWGVRAPVVLTGITTMIAAAVMWVMRNALATQVRAHGVPLPTPEAIVFQTMPIYALLGFILGTAIGCGAVGDDLRVGAFQFYFSRPLRARDYVAGKLTGLFLVVGLPTLGGPLVLALLRLTFADDVGELARGLSLLPRAAFQGVLGTLVLALPPAGLGALLRRRVAQAAWAIYYLFVANLFVGVAHATRIPLLNALSISASMDRIGRTLYGVDLVGPQAKLPLWAALAAVVVLAASSGALVARQISRAETSMLGGS